MQYKLWQTKPEDNDTMKKMRCIIIDNYDSFTYNLVHLLRELGTDVVVKHNDDISLEEIDNYDRIVLSPGPGIPSEAGLMPNIIKHYAKTKPILGVCLGHQAIAEIFGGKIEKLPKVFHGIETVIEVDNQSKLFKNLPTQISVGRYHSWIVSNNGFPKELKVIAKTSDGIIMALRHRVYNVYGIQFHPESVLTPLGKDIVKNWLSI